MTSEPKAPGAPAIILSYEEYDDSNTAEVMVHVRIKILGTGGIGAGTINIPDGILQSDDFSHVFMARTIQSNGTIVPFKGSPVNTTTSSGGRSAGHKVIAMPDVQVGSILEYSYHFASRNTFYTYLIGFYAPIWQIQRDYFVRSAHFSLTAPDSLDPGETRWVATLPDGAAPKRVKSHIILDMSDIPMIPNEENAPPASTVLYNVRFFYHSGSRDKYWGNTGDDVDAEWSKFDNPRKNLVAVVREMLVPTDTDDQKLRKIYAAVERLENTDYTRQRSEREDKQSGIHEAKNSDEIWSNKRGDSEDLTHLFVAMVRAAGFKAYPMAVASRDHAIFDQNVLSWSQMDSMVAIVDVGTHELFFDPGTRLCPFGYLAPWHSNVVGVSTEAKLVKTRSTSTQDFTASETDRLADLTLAPNGSVTGTLKLTWIHTAALPMRSQGLRDDEHEVEFDIEKRLQTQVPTGVEVHLKSLTGLSDGEVPLIAEFTVVGTLGTTTQKRMIIPSQFFASTSKRQLAEEVRIQPIAFPEAFRTRDQVVLRIPLGMSVESLPEARSIVVGTSTAYGTATHASGNDRQIIVTQRAFALRKIDYKLDEYAALRKYFGQVSDFDQDQITLHVAPSPEQARGGGQ